MKVYTLWLNYNKNENPNLLHVCSSREIAESNMLLHFQEYLDSDWDINLNKDYIIEEEEVISQ